MSELEAGSVDDPEAAECRAEVVRILETDPHIPEQLRSEFLRVIDRFIERREVRSAIAGVQLGSRGFFWAIRSDQLDLAKALSATALAIAAHNGAIQPHDYVLATAVIVAILDIARRVRRKGVFLDSFSYRVLLALKELGPTTPDNLAFALNGLRLEGPDVITEPQVRAALDQLANIRARDGTIEALAVRSVDGSWTSNGV